MLISRKLPKSEAMSAAPPKARETERKRRVILIMFDKPNAHNTIRTDTESFAMTELRKESEGKKSTVPYTAPINALRKSLNRLICAVPIYADVNKIR